MTMHWHTCIIQVEMSTLWDKFQDMPEWLGPEAAEIKKKEEKRNHVHKQIKDVRQFLVA